MNHTNVTLRTELEEDHSENQQRLVCVKIDGRDVQLTAKTYSNAELKIALGIPLDYHLEVVKDEQAYCLPKDDSFAVEGHERFRLGFAISVIYNGVPKEITVRPHELVKTVLEAAIHIFSPLPQPHTLSLYNEAGDELKDTDTVEQAGVHPHNKLLLRPSQVKGGAE